MRVGYIRTSTGKQLCDRQLLALEAQCDRVFIEAGVSATRRKRPVYYLKIYGYLLIQAADDDEIVKQLIRGDDLGPMMQVVRERIENSPRN